LARARRAVEGALWVSHLIANGDPAGYFHQKERQAAALSRVRARPEAFGPFLLVWSPPIAYIP
jgi:hypothetical protein